MTDPRRAALRAPAVAWPTVLLALLVPLAWLATLALGASGRLPLPAAVALASALAYLSFTPLHDATHRAVVRRRWLNDLLGRIAGVPLLAPFPAFRVMHLDHHKHVNEEEADPDLWSGSGPSLLLPLRWATQDLHYYARFFRERERFSRAEQVEIVALVGAQVAAGVAAFASGQGLLFLLLVLLPARLATAALAFAFDYLPHRPHRTPAREDRFRATHILRGRWLTLPLMGQNYHLVHHLYPAVPFYGYGKVWHLYRDDLLAQGAREVPLWGRELPGVSAGSAPTPTSSQKELARA